MYRHPPPRKCRGTTTGVNSDFNCVAFNWSWSGWICLYCHHTIGHAPAEISPGVSEKEEAAALWFRDRYRRQDEWYRRVRAGLETQPWHVGWEATPLPGSQVTHSAPVTAPVIVPVSVPVNVGQYIPTPAPVFPRALSAAAAHAEMMSSFASAMELSRFRMHLAQNEILLPPAAPPCSVEVNMEEFLATPARLVLEIAEEDVEIADAALVPHTESGVSSPTVDSPMEVEAVALEDKIPSGGASPLPPSPAEAPLSDTMTPMTPMTPEPAVQLVLQTEESVSPPPIHAPHSPTSSAIAALLDDDGPPRKKARKAPGRKPSVPGAPAARRGRPPKAIARTKEKDLRAEVAPSPKMSPKRKTPGGPGSKVSHLVSKNALTTSKPPSTPPKPSQGVLASPPKKAWQTTRIPKRIPPTVGGKNPAQCTPGFPITPDRTPTSSPAAAEAYLPSGTYST